MVVDDTRNESQIQDNYVKAGGIELGLKFKTLNGVVAAAVRVCY